MRNPNRLHVVRIGQSTEAGGQVLVFVRRHQIVEQDEVRNLLVDGIERGLFRIDDHDQPVHNAAKSASKDVRLFRIRLNSEDESHD